MKFICSLIVVEDIARSRRLFETILGQKVISDFGEYNVTFEGGLALYQKSLYQNLIGGERSILDRSHNFELYFEEDRLVEIEEEIKQNGFEFVHEIREEPWKQQVFRFYDEDHHIIVIAESMQKTSSRLFQEKNSLADIAKMTGLPVDEVSGYLKEYQEQQSDL